MGPLGATRPIRGPTWSCDLSPPRAGWGPDTTLGLGSSLRLSGSASPLPGSLPHRRPRQAPPPAAGRPGRQPALSGLSSPWVSPPSSSAGRGSRVQDVPKPWPHRPDSFPQCRILGDTDCPPSTSRGPQEEGRAPASGAAGTFIIPRLSAALRPAAASSQTGPGQFPWPSPGRPGGLGL